MSTGHPTGFSVFDRAFCKSDAVSHMSPSKKNVPHLRNILPTDTLMLVNLQKSLSQKAKTLFSKNLD